MVGQRMHMHPDSVNINDFHQTNRFRQFGSSFWPTTTFNLWVKYNM